MTALPYAEENMMICEDFSIQVREHDNTEITAGGLKKWAHRQTDRIAV